MKKKNINNEADEENDKKVIKRTLRLEARVTEQEYAKAKELAKTCGLSMSNYVRRTALGQHPRQRLSEREVEALCSLTGCKGRPYPYCGSREIHPSGQTSHILPRHTLCRAMDDSSYTAY